MHAENTSKGNEMACKFKFKYIQPNSSFLFIRFILKHVVSFQTLKTFQLTIECA